MTRIAPFILAVLMLSATARGAEIHSNGTGGGAWSDPASWRGAAVPASDDTVVISSGDTIAFDRDDDDDAKPTCKDLYLDPRAALTFKSGGKRTLNLNGPLETYGVIKIDASASAEDLFELRFISITPEHRNLKLAKGGALLVTGRAGLADGKRNAVIRSRPNKPDLPIPQKWGYVDGVPGTTLDVQQAHFDGVSLRATTIDNTGAKANERLNIAGCTFTNAAAISIEACDTPAIVGNMLAYEGDAVSPAGIRVNGCSLAEIRGNSITGPYAYGIAGSAMADSIIEGNTLVKCGMGIYWYGANAMFRSNTVRDCNTGMQVTSMSGALEDIAFDNCKIGISVAGATVQATNLKFTNVPQDGVRVSFITGPMTLVNCDLTSEQIRVEPQSQATPKPRVESMQYLIVGVKGALPDGASVDVKTANPPAPLPAGAMDMNIRNSPAALSAGGLTPLPRTLKPLIVKTWSIAGDGTIVAPPQYNVTIQAPPDTPDGEPKPLKTVPVTPEASWYRPEPNDPTPTVEVTIP